MQYIIQYKNYGRYMAIRHRKTRRVMIVGISTACLYPLETEKSLDLLLGQGCRSFEIFANSESEFDGNYIDNLLKMMQNIDAKVYSLHPYTSGFEPFMFFTDYRRRFLDSIELYKNYFKAAKTLGANAVVFHGDKKDGILDIDEYCERFYEISNAATEEGIILAQENVSRFKSRNADFIRHMRNSIGVGKVKFVLDIKQTLRAGESVIDMIDAMGTDIINVHVSDNNEQNDCLLPGQGGNDFNNLINHLKNNAYDGPLTIEVYRGNFIKSEELIKAKKFLEKLIEVKS